MPAGKWAYNPRMFGFLNVNKPVGPTSHDLVARLRRSLARGVKVGHAGTLDPKASGVLVLCVGPATRLSDYVQALPKRYVTTVTLGAFSTTDDQEGELSPTPDAQAPSAQAVQAVLARFVGEIQQIPPAFSAIHLPTGGRAYRAARAGREITLAPRGVVVYAIDLIAYAWPLLTLEIACGSGTYIRSIARDVGAALNVGGYCSVLTRTQAGPFCLIDAIAPDALDPAVHLLPPQLALPGTPRIPITADQITQIAMGRSIPAPDQPPSDGQPFEVALEDPAGHLIALATCHPAAGRIAPSKVFLSE
jgi:tRNA pseudouridine55 synthase